MGEITSILVQICLLNMSSKHAETHKDTLMDLRETELQRTRNVMCAPGLLLPFLSFFFLRSCLEVLPGVSSEGHSKRWAWLFLSTQ